MARLKAGQSVDAATAALRGLQRQIHGATLPPDWRSSDLASYLKDPFTLVAAATGNSPMRRRYQQPLITILVVVALVLLIASRTSPTSCSRGPPRGDMNGACGSRS